jgi:ketosteroid isomerase-like protein
VTLASENIELVRKLFDVYNERSFAENLELVDSEVVWDVSRVQLPESGKYPGRPGIREFFEGWEEGWEFDHVEAEEMVAAGDRVVVLVRHRGRGKESGIDVDLRYAMVWTLRDSRAVRMDMYPTRDDAMQAVGLEP